jgi:hypothetical protein
LSDEEAEKILEEEQAPIRQAQQAYKRMLAALIKRGFYPFNDELKNDLKKFQAERNLTDEEVERISKPILEAAEVEYLGKLRQRYEQEIKQVIEAGYPIDEVARHSLKNLQQSLGLNDEDVAHSEQPMIVPKEAEYQQLLKAERLRQAQENAKYENNLRQYEQAFSNAIRAEYPINQSVQEQLKSLQQSLGLKGEDITLIEQPILEQAEARYQEKLREAQRQRKLERQQQAELARQDTDDLSSEKGVDYTRLRDLLKAGQWKAADRETVPVMLKAAGRASEGWLDFASIENFPCTDLRIIDQLWVKYSKGRFGFSVQKKMWQEVNENYEAFCVGVGWQVAIKVKEERGWLLKKEVEVDRKKWLSYFELIFDLKAPQGHLPFSLSYDLQTFDLVIFFSW